MSTMEVTDGRMNLAIPTHSMTSLHHIDADGQVATPSPGGAARPLTEDPMSLEHDRMPDWTVGASGPSLPPREHASGPLPAAPHSGMTTRSMSRRRLGSGDVERMKRLSLHPDRNILQKEKGKYEQMCDKNLFSVLEKNETCCRKCYETHNCPLLNRNREDRPIHFVRGNLAFGVVPGNVSLTDMTEVTDNTLAEYSKTDIKEQVIVMQNGSTSDDEVCKAGPLTSLNGQIDQNLEQKTCKTCSMACATNPSPSCKTKNEENTKKVSE